MQKMKCKIGISFFLLFMILLVHGCSQPVGYSEADIVEEIPAGIEFTDITQKYSGHAIAQHASKFPYVEKKYMEDCFREEWYFCPPLDAVWQFKMILDACKDPPMVIEMGECMEKFECDPSNTSVEVIECLVDDVKGIQEKWCEKGIIKYTSCSPCTMEVCDGLDNDCDEVIDNDIPVQECENDCGPGDLLCVDGTMTCFGPEPSEEICDYQDNDCDDEIDEGQRNACDMCGQLPSEECNGVDDNCDGYIDEGLIQPCGTACGEGYEMCINGFWVSCTAPPELPEVCDGLDNDCDGSIDEELDCTCKIQDVGVLFPCTENPLLCGQGYKTCECIDPDCLEITTTPCYALCYWFPTPIENCDPYTGIPLSVELCNNFDDDCDTLIDEDLYSACYTGLEETMYVGICLPGEVMCQAGIWGNINENTDTFIPGFCKDEITPQTEVCNGEDDDCDGEVDWGEEIQDTDVLFVIDWSGSMQEEIQAVMTALNQFAANFSDETVIQWGVILGPREVTFSSWSEQLVLYHNLSGFSDFLGKMSLLNFIGMNTGSEMLLDALYLALHNITGKLAYQIPDLSWITYGGIVESSPPLEHFKIDWRPAADKIIIVFTDEMEQSYLNPKITSTHVIDAAQGAIQLKIYTFSITEGWMWDEIAHSTGGKYYKLTSNPTDMYNSLMEILDEICKGSS